MSLVGMPIGRLSSAEHSLKPAAGRPGMAEGASVMEDGQPQNSVANGAWTCRQSASLNLLLSEGTTGVCPGWFPTSQSAFNTVPSRLPPFVTFLQLHREVVVDQNPNGDGVELSRHETGWNTPLLGGCDTLLLWDMPIGPSSIGQPCQTSMRPQGCH